MAKILLSFLQPIINKNPETLFCYYDALSQELNAQGNDVLILNTLNMYYLPGREKQKCMDYYKNMVKDFNPDIIFAFNNNLYEEIISITNCPIILYEADLSNLFLNKDFIKKYNDRYYMVTFFQKHIPVYKDLGFNENRIIHLHPATAVKSEKKEKKVNISFIGSAFDQPLRSVVKSITKNNSENLYNLYKEYWNDCNHNYKELFEKYLKDSKLSGADFYPIMDSRTYILQSVLDLGLKIYGVNWDKLSTVLLPLISAFDKTPKYTLEDNQEVYNTSVINISISHPQCEGYAFPWRIYDILASDGVLVSSYAKALEDYTKGYVDIPMFKSPYDARDLCKKMLKEKELREDIISASNEFIEKQGRWFDNFEKIQNYTNVNIINNNHKTGERKFASYDFTKKDIKPQIKSIVYGILYSIIHLPLIYRESANDYRDKIYNSMIKYNKELLVYMKKYF